MKDTIVVRISRNVDTKAKEAAARLKISKKKFLEEAAMFFIRHQLSPRTYSPAADFDLSQLVQRSTEKILLLHQRQEQEILAPMALEILRTQAALQALINLILDLDVPREDQAAVGKQIEQYIQESLVKLQGHAHEGDQSAAGRA